MRCTLFGIAVLWNCRGYRAGTDRQSFFLRLNQCANAVTVKLVLIEQFESLGYGGRVVVKLKEHDTLGSLVGRPTGIPARRRERVALAMSPGLSQKFFTGIQ